MAVVRGVKEKVHLPLYDAKVFKMEGNKTFVSQITGNTIKFFIDVQSKTKLETNQQEAGVLSHFNTYEARALRVIVQPDGAEFLSSFIYNSVTTFFVGEKIMIQAPTWMFPGGAGEANDDHLSHGVPSPEATFRFAEPVHVDSQQNFRVEIEFPNGAANVFGEEAKPSKDTRVWVLIDGYITRDVQ